MNIQFYSPFNFRILLYSEYIKLILVWYMKSFLNERKHKLLRRPFVDNQLRKDFN